MTSWAPETDRELGCYTPLGRKLSFPQVPVSRGRYVNLVTVASGPSNEHASKRSQVVAELAMALAHMGKSVLVIDTDQRGGMSERVAATAATERGRYLSLMTGSQSRVQILMPRRGIWVVGSSSVKSHRGLRALLRRGRASFDYVVASVSPTTANVNLLAFHSGLFIVVDPEPGPLLSTAAVRAAIDPLRFADAPELFLLLRDRQDAALEGPAEYRLGSSGPAFPAWDALPPGTAFTPEEGFVTEGNPRAGNVLRLAEAIDDRSGASQRGPEPPTGPARVASQQRLGRRPDAANPVEAFNRSLERSSSGRCRVDWCDKRPASKAAFCSRHLPERMRVAGYGVDSSGLKVLWYKRCEATGCWNPCLSKDTHCWEHERALHPERVCRIEGCDECASDWKWGGTYCWEHDEANNPHYPYASSRNRTTSYLMLASLWIVLAPLVLWIVVFGVRWLATDADACAAGAYDWTWFGPRCSVTHEELWEVASDARRSAHEVYDAEIDRRFDALVAECTERAARIERVSEGRIRSYDVIEACMYTGLSDLEDLAKEMDAEIDDAAQQASDDLYEERTGSSRP